jgi:hypothetical protein
MIASAHLTTGAGIVLECLLRVNVLCLCGRFDVLRGVILRGDRRKTCCHPALLIAVVGPGSKGASLTHDGI